MRVRAGDDGVVTLDCVISGNFHGLVLLELNVLAVNEHTGTDLGSLSVEHKGDVLIGALSEGLVEGFNLLAMGLVVTMGEVEAGDVHTGIDHLDELLNFVAGGSKSADDFGAAEVGVNGFKDVVELDVLGVGGDF